MISEIPADIPDSSVIEHDIFVFSLGPAGKIRQVAEQDVRPGNV
jgi:hypothetical protein